MGRPPRSTLVHSTGRARSTLTATATGFSAADAATLTLSATRASGEAVASYVITPAASGAALSNYTVTYVPGTFAISHAAATGTAVRRAECKGRAETSLVAEAL